MIYGLTGAAFGGGVGYLIFDTAGAIGGGIFGGLVGLLSGAILRVAADADAMEAEANAQSEEPKVESATEECPRKKKSKSA